MSNNVTSDTIKENDLSTEANTNIIHRDGNYHNIVSFSRDYEKISSSPISSDENFIPDININHTSLANCKEETKQIYKDNTSDFDINIFL